MVLASDPQHAKVRRRRARIFDKLGRNEEALAEICADLLIQREAFKKALQAGRQADQPTPVDNVESVMRAVGAAAAEEVLAARRASGAKFGMPSSNTITQLLMTYAAYDARAQAASTDSTDYATAIKGSSSIWRRRRDHPTPPPTGGDGDLFQEIRSRAQGRRIGQCSKVKAEANGQQFPPALVAELERAAGLYKHLVHDLSGAAECYERLLSWNGSSKKGGNASTVGGRPRGQRGHGVGGCFVRCCLTDADGASVSDVHMHRAQLRVIRRDLEAAKNDLEACIAVAPGHVLARLRLATVLIHSGADAQSVEEQVEAAERLAPTMSEVYQVKGEVLLAKADLEAPSGSSMKLIRLDESNPVPLYNKGLTFIQMNQFEAHNAQKLFESALAVDPTCMVALMRLSELKLQLAASFDQAQAVVDMLGGAMQNCRDKDELVELSTVRAMAVAQLAGALGTSG